MIDAVSGGNAWAALFGRLGQATGSGAMPKNREARLFNRLDADGSGGVSKDEFGAMYQRFETYAANKTGANSTGVSTSLPSVDDVFGKIDADGDGNVTQDEFTTWLDTLAQMTASQASAATSAPTADDLFAQLDSDGDGSVTKDEFTTWFSQMVASHQANGHHHRHGGAIGGVDNNGLGSLFRMMLQALSPSDTSSGSSDSQTSAAVGSIVDTTV